MTRCKRSARLFSKSIILVSAWTLALPAAAQIAEQTETAAEQATAAQTTETTETEQGQSMTESSAATPTPTPDTQAVQESPEIQAQPQPDVLDQGYLAQQIASGEAATASRDLKTRIKAVENEYHRYHPDLVVPLALLGDAYMAQEEYDQALDEYARARHIARVSHGLFDARQVDLLYKEANALRRVGDLKTAVKREEYAYEVMRKNHTDYSPELLPALYRLADFYVATHNYLAARSLYRRAVVIHETNGSNLTPAAVPAYQGLAQSHRLERFPPFYVNSSNDNRQEGPQPGLITNDLQSQHITFNNFPSGERALQRIVEIRKKQIPADERAELEAILDLADWHLMFGRSTDANTLYSHVYERMSGLGDDAAEFFSDPRLIYWPLPHDPTPPPIRERDTVTTGHVVLGFSVNKSGRVRNLQTLASEPRKLMDFRVRRSMRMAVFRPRLLEAMPVLAEGQTYTHEFKYFPRRDDDADPATIARAATTGPEDQATLPNNDAGEEG